MANDNKVLRSVNELSLAAWFGGSLMGATGMRRASSVGGDEIRAEGAGWSSWQPVQTAAIAAQLFSSAGLTFANRGRYFAQRGVASTSLARMVLTAGAVAATAGAASAGRELSEQAQRSEPDRDEVARLEGRTRMFQWLVPFLTGGMVVLDAVMGEQQRPQRFAEGVLQRLLPWR